MKWIVAMALCGFLSTPALADERAPAVAVHLLEGRGVDLSEQELVELTDYAGVRFGEAAACQIIPWAQVQKQIRTKGYYACMDRHCQIEAERLTDADFSLALSVLPMGQACIVTGSLYPRESPATSRTAMHKGVCTKEEIAQSLEQVVKQLTSQGPLERPRAVDNPRPGEAPPPPPAGSGPTEREDFEGSDEDPGGAPAVVMVRSPMYVAVYGVYAPAPILWYDSGYGRDTEKMLDQFGPRFVWDMEVSDIWLAGIQVDVLGNQDHWLVEVIGRGGGQIVFGDTLQLFGLMGIGGSAWVKTGWGGRYEGVVLNATLGARYMFMPAFGLQFELSGTASFFEEDDDYWADEDLDMFRLETALGVVIAF